MLGSILKEFLFPIFSADFRLMPAAHGQQAVNIRLQQIFAGVFRQKIRENIAELIGELERALLLGKADGGRRQRLGEGKQSVRDFRLIRIPPGFCKHLAMP